MSNYYQASQAQLFWPLEDRSARKGNVLVRRNLVSDE